jgi:hypothetical protein
VVVLLLELHLDVGEVTGRPLLVAPCLDDLFAWNDFQEFAADVSTEEDESGSRKNGGDLKKDTRQSHSLSILGKVHFDVATSEGSDEFHLAEAVEEGVTLALELLLEDDRLAVDFHAHRLAAVVRRCTRG